MTYLDTSALIKRFVAEAGSAVVQRLVGHGGPVATATVAYFEVYAGVTRKRREGHLSAAEYTRICRQFERDWGAYIRVELVDEILRVARRLIQRHPLRGVDAIHLASAVNLGRDLEEAITFVAADERLLKAAAAERLSPLSVG